MATTRVKKRVRPSKSGKTETIASPMSLPPSGSGSTATDAAVSTDQPASEVPAVPAKEKKPYWYRERTSKAYEQSMRIFAMRAAGIDDKQIAEALRMNVQSVHNLVQIAGKNGWVSDQLAKAKDVVEFQILPKVLRELEAGLDDAHRNEKTGMQVKTLVAMKVAENTVFKSFEQAGGGNTNNNAISIKIEMVPGPPQQMREGTIAGSPAYIDADFGETDNVGESGLVPAQS